MQKNVSSQKIQLFCFLVTTGAPVTGDAANITAYVSKDHGAVTVLGDTSATEMDATNAKGVYVFDLTQGETNADELTFTAKSSTANVSITPRFITTTAPNFSLQSIDGNGRVDVIKIAGTTQTARDVGGAVPAAAAGAPGGLLISGSNSGTTTFGALTVTGATTLTGNVAMAAGLTVTQSTLNSHGVVITGNGTGSGALITGGSGGTGEGVRIRSNSTNGNGLTVLGTGTGKGLEVLAGATGIGLSVVGGGTSGDGMKVTTTSGHGLNLAPVGTDKHGIFATGGNGGTSDGVKAVAGTGGVPIRGDITGNITGSVASVTGLTASDVGSIKTSVENLQTRVPTALSNGKMDSTNSDVAGRGTVGSGSTTTSVVTSAFSPAGAVADQFKGRIILFDNATTTAALRGQGSEITASSNSSTPTLTVNVLTTAPVSTDTFTIA